MLRAFTMAIVFCVLPVFIVAGHAPAASLDAAGPSGQPETAYQAGEILVKFKPDVSESAKDKIHAKHGSTKIREFRYLRIEHIKLKKGMTVEDAIKRYTAETGVEYAEPNYIVTAQAVPYDPLFDRLWGLSNYGQTGGTNGADIKAPQAWDVTTGAPDGSIVVAVVDTGIDYHHEDLAANMWVNAGEIAGNGSDDDGNGYIDDVHGINAVTGSGDPLDDHGHGTHVGGTIGAVGNNGIGVAGVNWDVRIAGCKFLTSAGTGSVADAVECLEYFRALRERGVPIVATNNSWGGFISSQALFDAVSNQRDILFIAAAGNYNLNNDVYGFYPAKYDLPQVVAVAATDHNDAKAVFSNYGRHSVQVSAPGVDIVSLRAGETDMYGDGLHFVPAGDPAARYYMASGTSMAAPHVTGLAALLKAADPARSWVDIRNRILAGGDAVPALNGATVTGRRINAWGALTCMNGFVFSARKYPITYALDVPTTLSALSIDCATPVGPVTATASDGSAAVLHDNGVPPDLVADDGVFTATWTPLSVIESMTFSSAAGVETVPANLFSITTASLPDGRINTYYSAAITTTGGVSPYTWSIASGSLPPGLGLVNTGGAISGTPTSLGTYAFTVRVVDGNSTPAAREYSIVIGRKNVR